MERDEVLRRVTDALCGELNAEEEAQVRAALAADPALATEARRLESIWHELGRVRGDEQQVKAVLARIFDRILEQHQAELSDEDLDKAAGGASSRPDRNPITT